MKILLMGLSGAGKTTLASLLVPRLKAVWFNADAVRENLNKDLGFSLDDRVEQARRMGFLCDTVSKAGYYAVADFICPTNSCRVAFRSDFTIWIDRIQECKYEDTNQLFNPPLIYDLRLSTGTPEEWADKAYEAILRK